MVLLEEIINRAMIGSISFSGSRNVNNIKLNSNIVAFELFNSNLEKPYMVEASFQLPELRVSPHGILQRNKIFQETLDEWNHYKSEYRAIHFFSFKRFANLFYTNNIDANDLIAKEILLSEKHIYLWRTFLESRSSLLCVMEDDAFVVDSKSIISNRWSEFCDYIISSYGLDILELCKRKNLYIDCAGGLEMADLGISAVWLNNSTNIPPGIISFKKLFSNTCCMYMLSRPLALEMYKIVSENSALRYLPADWLINKCAIEIFNQGIKTHCYHFNPPLIQHGSIIQGVSSMR